MIRSQKNGAWYSGMPAAIAMPALASAFAMRRHNRIRLCRPVVSPQPESPPKRASAGLKSRRSDRAA